MNRDNYQIETNLYDEGYEYIAGIDEVGRGPLAGPVVAACVIMPKNFYIEGVTDSKKLSLKKRIAYNDIILKNAISVSTVFIDQTVIDKINIYEATKQAMYQSIKNLEYKPDYILIDAMPLTLDIPHESLIKGDLRSFMIACASIVAKVARDNYMQEQAKIYPNYGFESHMGYGTKKHLEALQKYGVTPIHRKTYAPVKKILDKSNTNVKQLSFELFEN